MNVFRSIRWQFIFWQLLLLAGVLLTLLTLYYHLHRKELIAATDHALQRTLMFSMPGLASDLRHQERMRAPPHDMPHDGPRPPLRNAEMVRNNAVNVGMYFYTETRDGEVTRYGDVPEDMAFGDYVELDLKSPRVITKNGNREIVFFHVGRLLVVIGQPLSVVQDQLMMLKFKLILIGLGILTVGGFSGWLIVRRVLRPIKEISDAARVIAGGDTERRVELSSAPTELEGLAGALNRSFDHLDESIQLQMQFSSDASHELRTPIAVVIAQCQAALKRDRSTDEYKMVLNACLRAGERMKTMANSLLELTRIDASGASLSKQKFDLNAAVSEAVSNASHLSEKHPILFIPLADPLESWMDQFRIQQIVENLLGNAIKHNPDGCTIEVKLEKGNRTAVLLIADEGQGIPPEAVPHIFDRFYRADKSRSREQGGAGLGLSIVKKLVEAHQGTIQVSSVPELGTTFTIKLPLA